MAKLTTRGPKIVANAMHEEAKIEMKEMKARTPKDTGDLEESGEVDDPEMKNGEIRVPMHFGNDEVDYAVYVHEDLDAYHRTGQAKYMESVLNESAPHMAERIAKRTRPKLEKLVR